MRTARTDWQREITLLEWRHWQAVCSKGHSNLMTTENRTTVRIKHKTEPNWTLIPPVLPFSFSFALLSLNMTQTLRFSREKLLRIPKSSLKSFAQHSLCFIAPTVLHAMLAGTRNSPLCLNWKPGWRVSCWDVSAAFFVTHKLKQTIHMWAQVGLGVPLRVSDNYVRERCVLVHWVLLLLLFCKRIYALYEPSVIVVVVVSFIILFLIVYYYYYYY